MLKAQRKTGAADDGVRKTYDRTQEGGNGAALKAGLIKRMEPPKRRGSLSLEGFGFLRENLIGVFELLTDAFGRRAAE